MKKVLSLQLVNKVFSEIQEENNIFSISHESLAKGFLKRVLPEVMNCESFDEKRELFINNIDWDLNEIPNNEDEFYKFICSEIFRLQKLPNESLIEILEDCQDDLEEINERKSKYENDLIEINKNKEIEGKKYKKNLLIYYINKLKKAESDIVSFIRDGLMETAYNNASGQSDFFLLAGGYRYGYRNFKIFYAVENLNEISSKIPFVSMKRFFELLAIYKTDKKKFFRILKKEHPAKNFIQVIEKRVKENHTLHKRKYILNQLLSFYKNKNYKLFINLCPQQIEGLIYDLALEAGIKEDTLKTSSVSDKAQFLKDKTDFFHDMQYEYYRFVFPIIRNRIAHGLGIAENIADTAYSLLLDLNYIAELICSDKLRTNQAVAYLKKAEKKKDLNSLIFYGEFIDVEIPKFYKISSKREEVERHIIQKFKYNNLKPIVAADNLMFIQVKKTAEHLRRLGINKEDCTQIIKDAENKKLPNIA